MGEFADALIATLGDATAMSAEDTGAIADLYTDNRSTSKVLPSTTKTRGDEAAGSPATSIAQACSKKDSISSLEDEISNNVIPLDEGIGTNPMDEAPLADTDTGFTESARKRRQHTISRLTQKV